MSINKNYQTSVRRACRKLVTLGARTEHSNSFEMDAWIDESIVEVTEWIVKQARKQAR